MYRNPHGTCRIQYTDNQQDEASPNSTVRKHPPEYGEVISLIKGKKKCNGEKLSTTISI